MAATLNSIEQSKVFAVVDRLREYQKGYITWWYALTLCGVSAIGRSPVGLL